MGELFDDDEDCENGGRDRGREVYEVPLCANCQVEAELDEVGNEAVVKRGLRRVERLDGGVTRKRWEEKESTHLRKTAQPATRKPPLA